MREPKQLYAYPLTGLFKECFEIDYDELRSPRPIVPDGKFCLRSINNLWWHQALSLDTLNAIVAGLEARHRYTSTNIPQHRTVLADPQMFIDEVQAAPRILANLNAGARSTFRALETLQIFCSLYGDIISSPYALSLQEGFVLNELSSLVLAREALNARTNPYLPFIEKQYLPILNAVKPDILWIVGQIRMSTFAMAMMARHHYPNCHISVTGHVSEYYSLNKITKYLKQNDVLFSVIDSIILDDFENTIPQLVECIAAEQPLSSVPNLLYVNRTETALSENIGSESVINLVEKRAHSPLKTKAVITDTPMMVAYRTHEYYTSYHPVSLHQEEREENHVDPSEIVDIRLWPNAKCYWDKCNFCAINRKYQTLPKNSFKDVEAVADYMISVAREHSIRYFWSSDEAIPPSILGELAQHLIDKDADFLWETRSKIDKHFSKEVCKKLGDAGLREIRLGLESASPRVLSQMGKFPTDWSLELIEKIVSYFHESGVSVHFPTIIGFPTETEAERLETFTFLEYITTKYPSVTFNMNILGFDIASELFENYEQHGITSIHWPTPAKYFLGNLLDWNCQEVPFEYEKLDYQRNELMRQLLYPWIPTSATIPEYIFYRLAETSRATMVWKAQRSTIGNWTDRIPDIQDDLPLLVSSGIVVSGPLDRGQFATDVRYLVYDWHTHHMFECDRQGLSLLEVMKEGIRTVSEIMLRMKEVHKNLYCLDDIYQIFGVQLHQLYEMGIVQHFPILGQPEGLRIPLREGVLGN